MGSPRLPRRFHAFTLTQGLGAFNDNLFKMLLQLYVVQVYLSVSPEEIISKAVYVFTIPFVLFGPWAGYLADRYAKYRLMLIIKISEIAIMILGALAFHLGHINFMLFILFLMATQSTFFSPAKMGIIPEICDNESITHANSWIEMSTFVAVIAGIAATGLLFDFHQQQATVVSFYCIGVAVLGALTAAFIPISPPGSVSTRFPWNPLQGILRDLAFLRRSKGLWLAGLANSYFWLLGLIFSTNILVYGKKLLRLSADQTVLLSLLPAFMGIGIAAGSMLAGRWSGKKVELGLVPLGGLGMAAAGILLEFTVSFYWATALTLTLAGICGGLFIVPLYAYLQFTAGTHEKGRVMATTGILNGIFLVLGGILYDLLAVRLAVAANHIYLIMGLFTVLVVIYICTIIPEYFIRFSVWLLTHTFYNIKIVGEEHVPFHGPALLTPNHVSYVDSFLIGSTVQRFIKFVMLKSYYEVPVLKRFLDIMEVIPIAPEEGRSSIAASLETARRRLQNGKVVCIFPEGKLTRDGKMNEFRRGFETVMRGLDCPIIPVYMHNVWGSIFSYKGNKVLRKWPHRIPYPITICYGEPLPPDSNAATVQAAVAELARRFNPDLQKM